jgi:DNA-binding transcriptional ArsR family regulator
MRRVGKSAPSARSGSARARTDRSIADAQVWRAMRLPLRFQILEAIRATPGSSARELADALGTTVSRIHYHLRILLDAGLIAPRSDARGGAEASRYSAAFVEFPPGFFGRAAGVEARREQLMHALARQGLRHASRGRRPRRGEPAPRAPRPNEEQAQHFSRLERLDERDLAEVLRHAAEISRIVESARARRTRGAPIAAATHFVGVCVTPLRAPALPDAPID